MYEEEFEGIEAQEIRAQMEQLAQQYEILSLKLQVLELKKEIEQLWTARSVQTTDFDGLLPFLEWLNKEAENFGHDPSTYIKKMAVELLDELAGETAVEKAEGMLSKIDFEAVCNDFWGLNNGDEEE